MQNYLTDMLVPYENGSITLEDICFAPLAPGNSHCAIMSVLNYFQNNVTRLNKKAYNGDPMFDMVIDDYTDHFTVCTQ